MDCNGVMWFFTDRRSEKVEHLNAVNFCFSDANRATYVSVSGHAELDGDRTRMARLWTAFSRPWFPDGPQSLNLILLKFIPDKAEYWDAPSSKMIRMFALAASLVAGKPVGMGEHDSIPDLNAPQRRTA
jgi:general stress protein 26